MSVISVSELSKKFNVYKKEQGFVGSVKSLFNRKYETVEAVHDISFEVAEGELVGFIGPNGAGKTTTLKCLSGLLYPSSGTVNVLGFTPFERDHSFLKQISLIMGQKNQLWWDLPAIDSFALNKEIYDIPDKVYKKTLDQLTELLEIKDILHVQVKKLSLGQRMKCELIAALIHTPKVLFLDEPTIGLDVLMQQKLREFIKEYNKQYKASILLTSHYMKDVEELCERVIIIDHGRKMYDGNLASLVHTYAKNKFISVVFGKAVEREKIGKLGQVISFEDTKAVISIPRAHSNDVAGKLLQSFPVVDLNIEEQPVEEIIQDLFSKKGEK